MMPHTCLLQVACCGMLQATRAWDAKHAVPPTSKEVHRHSTQVIVGYNHMQGCVISNV